MKGALLALAVVPVLACIWDSDTLDDELRGLPDAEALAVTGRWYRHGRAYYGKRLRELPPRLEADPPDLDAFDDLAVAQEKLGDHDGAVATMDRKAAALAARPDPDHLYRMHGNRGTFHAHAGRFDEALADLEAAIALNPQAHFGRERYQVDAIRYVRAATVDPALWSRGNFLAFAGYATPLPTRAGEYPDREMTRELDRKEALAAIEGMLRFGGKEGAELYRAWGDLQLRGGNLHLAWWAWHRALDRGHPAKEALREGIAKVEHNWSRSGTYATPTEATWEAMRASGEAWLAAFHAAEEGALARGEDPAEDAVLGRLLAEADDAAGPPPAATTLSPGNLLAGRNLPWLIPPAAIAFITLLLLWDRRRKRRAAAAGKL